MCKHDLILVIDTNILGDIIKKGNSLTIQSRLDEWLLEIKNKISCYIKGRVITFVFSNDTMNDYITGFSRMNLKIFGKGLTILLDKGTFMSYNLETSRVKCRYSLRRISITHKKTKDKSHRRKLSDTYDEKFVDLIYFILKQSKWANRKIIFASRDRTFQKIEDIFNRNLQRFTYVKTIDELEKTIIC